MHKHIVSGVYSALTLREHLREPLGSFAIFEDSFLHGPLSSFKDADVFLGAREKFWKEHSFEDNRNFLTYSYKEFIEHILAADSYTLWLSPGGHDLFMWAWLTHIFKLYKIDWKKLQIKPLVDDEKPEASFFELGSIASEKISRCKSFELDTDHILTLEQTYDALTSSTPEKLLEICGKTELSLPELQKSLRVYLKTYPEYKNGLTLFDRTLLANCEDRQLKSARIVGQSMMHDEYENCFTVGDAYLFARLIKMTQLSLKNPLIHLHGTIKGRHSMRHTEVNITDLGKSVLEGAQNNIALNGIDERIGGVHLSSSVPKELWFYKDGTLIKNV